MARKILAILLAVSMIVPMVLSQAIAADPTGSFTYTAAIRYDSEAGHGYSQIPGGSYPDKAYHLMTRVIINYTDRGAEGGHGSISWVNGDPNSAYGFDFYTGKAFVAMTGWDGKVGDGSNFLAQVPYTLVQGEYYQFDWYVSDTEIKGYVNGDLVISYTGTGLWNPGGYIISYPNQCGYDICEYVVTAQDNSATYCANVAAWSYSGPLWGSNDGGYTIITTDDNGDPLAYTVETYEIIDWQPYADAVSAQIAAIGTVGYNEWISVTDTNSMSYEAAAAWGPYTDVQAAITAPSRIEMDVQLVENKSGESLVGGFPHSGGGAFLGYNVDAGKFYIAENRSYPDYDTKYAFTNAVASTDGTITLDTTKAYTIGLVYGADYVAIEFQGKEVLRSTAYSFASGDIHLPVVNAKFNFLGYRVYGLSSGALVQEDNWSAFSSNATLGKGITCTADMFVNSGAAITAAEEAYAALPAEAQALVSNYSTLTNARTTYDAKVQAVAQAEADGLIAKINTIGTVTLEDQALIAECEEEYSNMDPVVQALVSNYATLTAARAQYDAYVAQKNALEAKIASIGTVYYNTETNRDSDYDNTGLLVNFTTADGYLNIKDQGATAISRDYQIEFDIQFVDWDASHDTAQFAWGSQSWQIGYDFPTQSFSVNAHSESGAGSNLDGNEGETHTTMELIPDLVYHWKFQARGNRVTLFVDDVKVAESHDLVRTDGQYCIFYPMWCTIKIANYSFYAYNASYDEPAIESNLCGDALKASATFPMANAWSHATVVPMHADAILDDGALIAECEDDYDALDAYAKTLISNYATLTAARTTYDALADDPAVGAVVALINDIGEVTLASGDAIAAAEAAYAALDAAQQAKVDNYATLTAARTTYDALVAAKERADRIAAVEAAIDAIGTVFYLEDPTAVDQGILVDVLNYNDKGYSHVGSLNAGNPFTIEYDFVPVANGDQDSSWTGFGLSNGIGAGYSYKEQKFFISANAKVPGGSTDARVLTYASDVFPLELNTIYHIKFDFGTSESAVYVDGVKVVSSTEQLCAGSSWCIFYPQYCSYKMSNLTITSNGTTLCEGLTGQALADNTYWSFGEYFNSVGLVPMLVDSESAILDARSAYDALAADEQADVSNYAVLTAAEARYAELSNPAPAVTYGDANGDGEINTFDVILIARYLLDDTLEIGAGADANGDGEINTFDVILIARYLLDDQVPMGPQA